MKLVIAEKPSVAQSLAKVIGATDKKDGYLEGNGYIVSWCVGHLIELAGPEGRSTDFSCAFFISGDRFHQKAVSGIKGAHEAFRCGWTDRSNRCRTRGRADLSSGLSPGGM